MLGTRKWIGAVECWSLLESFGVHCTIVQLSARATSTRALRVKIHATFFMPASLCFTRFRTKKVGTVERFRHELSHFS